MIRLIQLKLSKIKYSGDSIGDDIRMEIEVGGQFLRVDKIIKAGTTVEINKEICRLEIDQKLFKANARITVIEKDALFNDVGSMGSDIEINTSITKPQQFIYKVQIRETRSVLGKFWGTKTAVFEITLEAEVSDVIKYVPDEGDGWLKVVLQDKHSEESLPAYLKVKIERVDAKREYFTILEGPYRGQQASVKLRKNGLTWFISDAKHEPMMRAKYSISQKIFILKSKRYKTVDYPEAPWKKGLYDIEIPDYPHPAGENYPEAKRGKTWFRIGHSGERYLHPGGYSLGCMTIIETTRWMEIYNVLIKARGDDFMSVGVLEVVE